MFSEDILKQFLERFDKNKHQKMIDVYIISFKNHLTSCQTAITEQDLTTLKSSSHDLKSLCRTLGALNEGHLAEKIEKHLKDDQEDAALCHIDALLEQIEYILEIMDNYTVSS